MRFAVVFLSVVTAAVAQLTINTPVGAISCLNQQISWSGGTAPYTIQVQPGGDTTQAAIETFTGLAASPYSWHVIEPANTQVFLRLRDNTGATAESGTFTIQAGGGTCSGSSSASVAPASSSSGAAVPPPATSSSTPVAPPPASGTTTTPAPAGTTTTPAAGGSGSSSTTHTTTSASAAGLKMSVVGGGAVGVVVAGMVALLA